MPAGAFDNLDQRVYSFPMRVELLDRARSAKEMETLLEIARERAVDPSVFDDSPPFFWRATVSNTNLDSYGTFQQPSSLQNFAADLSEGVAFLASHNWRSLPMGHSLVGQFVRKHGEKPARTWGDFYTLPDLNLNGINTSDFIKGTKAGIIRDVSKGFYGGFWRCSICGNDYRKYGSGEGTCNHWLLEEYEIDGKTVLCTVGVEDAHISEVSAVYDGSVPGAAIEKAVLAIEAGEVPIHKARELALRYRSPLPGTEHLFLGFTRAAGSAGADDNERTREASPVEKRKDPDMGDNAKATPLEPSGDVGILQSFWRTIHDALRDAGLSVEGGKDAATLIRAMAAELTELKPLMEKVRVLEAKVKELEPLAEDGRGVRESLITETWKAYVAAGRVVPGTQETVEKEKRAVWSRLSLSEIRADLKHFGEQAKERQGGGRLSTEGEPEPGSANGQLMVQVPLSALKTPGR